MRAALILITLDSGIFLIALLGVLICGLTVLVYPMIRPDGTQAKLFTVRPNSALTPSMFENDSCVVGRITSSDEAEYWKEIENFVTWCQDNSLSLDVRKTKELVINFGKNAGVYAPSASMVPRWKWLRASCRSLTLVLPTSCRGPTTLM